MRTTLNTIKNTFKRISDWSYNVSFLNKIQTTIDSLSPFEKVIFWILTAGVLLSTLGIISQINTFTTTSIPTRGGAVIEGVVGAPRFINPLIAQTDTDRDLTMLIYSGLMKASKNGDLIPDLAKRYTVSEDGRVYTFTLKDDVKFHDGTPLTADDILFTIQKAQDPIIKSTRIAEWDGVSVKKINAREVEFTLKTPYAPFLENTTLGILPKHIWKNVPDQEFAFSKFNTNPIGSGPFKLKNIKYDSSGVPSRYELKSFEKYALGRPYINRFLMYFYSNEDDLIRAYASGKITSLSAISSNKIEKVLKNDSVLEKIDFPRVFALFLNQNKNHALVNSNVRKALDTAIDKQALVEQVLNGFGTPINSPIPPGTVEGQAHFENSTYKTQQERNDAARALLEKSGATFDEEAHQWKLKKEPITITISTANTPELKMAADIIAKTWENIGIQTKVRVYDTGDLNQNVIRPRDYEALLFGEVVGRGLDLFAFWHSSQKDDPGLNISMYTNTNADTYLEKARKETDAKLRNELYLKFEKTIQKDTPALFLYSPDFIYITPKSIKGTTMQIVATPSERFSEISTWYTQTERVWNFFLKNKNY